MAARTPRRSFAAPFVITLAAVPACYVQTAPPPNQPPPPPPQTEPQSPPPQQPQGPVTVTNPPRPTPPPQQPDPPPPRPPQPQPRPPQPQPQPTTPPVTTPHGDMAWTVFKNADGCMAAIKVECQPKATCNPPPPFKIACPADVNLDKPVTVVSQDGGSTCMVQFPMPTCPPGTACNPPRPRRVECPKR